MIDRSSYINEITEVFEIHSVCAILGPRQCGKTTLAALYAANAGLTVHRFDLENHRDLNALASPSLALDHLEGLIIIDEIQRRPELFPYLRYLSDYSNKKFLILGSASRDLIHQSSESLAGRISYIELTPFSLTEISNPPLHWRRGGFPKSYLANSNKASMRWRDDYIRTFIEQDLALLGFNINSILMRRLWMMISHYHGGIMNYSEVGRSLDITDKTIKRYLEILSGAFMIRLLKPFYVNIAKRQVKRPKIYVRDSGLLHNLWDVDGDIDKHPKLGSSFEGYALEEVIRITGARSQDCYFWAEDNVSEIDLVIIKGAKKLGFEFKYSDAPKVTKSMYRAMEILNLSSITVINPGADNYKLTENISVIGLEEFARITQQKT
jgi:predicted AAA+ superfamily ATPase